MLRKIQQKFVPEHENFVQLVAKNIRSQTRDIRNAPLLVLKQTARLHPPLTD